MKHEEKKIYSAPEVEIIEVAVEKGFATSIDPMPYDNGWS